MPTGKKGAGYDRIARQYQASKKPAFREIIEWYSYNKLPGDVSQKSAALIWSWPHIF